jgi:aldehyde:ferredoxin oxidoreductase
MHTKGLELPAFDPRGLAGQGLAFATSNRGGCHSRANMLGFEVLGVPRLLDRFAIHGKAAPLIHLQNLSAVLDSLMQCKFAAYVLKESHFSRLLTAVTGEHIETRELLRIGERIWNLERLFNIRARFTRADDTLPRRMLHEPVAEGPSKGHVVDLEPMLQEYYERRGWSAQGVPLPRTLDELGISRTREGEYELAQ